MSNDLKMRKLFEDDEDDYCKYMWEQANPDYILVQYANGEIRLGKPRFRFYCLD